MIRTDSVLSGQKVALKTFIQLLFCLSIEGLTGIAVYASPPFLSISLHKLGSPSSPLEQILTSASFVTSDTSGYPAPLLTLLLPPTRTTSLLKLQTSLPRNAKIALFSTSSWCIVHLEPGSTPPPMPDPILDFPALELSDSASEDLLQRIQIYEY